MSPGVYRAVHLACARKEAAPLMRGSCEQAPEVMPIGRCPNRYDLASRESKITYIDFLP
jgi:hypothetical protein